MHTATLERRRRRDARLRDRLHGRGRGRAPAAARARRGRLGRAAGRRAPSRPASAPATRCAWRSASTCTATTWTSTAIRSRRGSAGAARRGRASSAPRRSPPPASAAPSRSWRRSCSPGRGIPRQGNAVVDATARRSGVVTSGTLSPCARRRDRDGLRRRRARRAGHRGRDRRSRQAPPGAHRVEAPVHERRASDDWQRRATRTSCGTTPSTTGPGSTATRRPSAITWYAQDALGEVVFYEPPEVGSQAAKDQAYAEVESVKAVSDVYAPLSGEIIAVNDAVAEQPGADQRGPLRRGLAGQGEALRPVRGRRAARRRGVPQAARGGLGQAREGCRSH